MFLPHFDVFCDLLVNRSTATWNLLVFLTQVILAFWLVLAYDLLGDRRTIDVIVTKLFLSVFKNGWKFWEFRQYFTWLGRDKNVLPRHWTGSKNRKRNDKNQWSVPAILLFTKNADYENEKCLKIKVFICILPAKEKKGHLFLTSTRRYENLTKVSPFLIKGGTFSAFCLFIQSREKSTFFTFLCFDFSAGSCQGDRCQHLVDAPFFRAVCRLVINCDFQFEFGADHYGIFWKQY